MHDGALIITVQALLNDDVSITPPLTELCMTWLKLTLILVDIPDMNSVNIT